MLPDLLLRIEQANPSSSGCSCFSGRRKVSLACPVGAEEGNKKFNQRDSRSYSEVLGKSKVTGGWSGGEGSEVSEVHEKCIIVPDRTSAFEDLYGIAVVGRTVDLEALVDFDKLLKIAGTPYSRLEESD
ncbi:hypothetical protein Hanom_Chr10g00899431 [Helianthus anomalus]